MSDKFWDSFDSLDQFQAEMMYQGFDPEVTFSLLSKASTTVTSSFSKDVAYMVVLCCERSNNLMNIKNRSKEKAREAISKLTANNKLVSKATEAKHITLSRVTLIFPG